MVRTIRALELYNTCVGPAVFCSSETELICVLLPESNTYQ